MTNPTPRPDSTAPFAVFDVETTGFAATGVDRVIEIAVVLSSPTGERLDEYVTLVNPERDAGPTHVHGISSAELVDAPSFEAVAGDIAERMSGAVLVGHNVSFDLRFLRAEFERIGHELPSLHSVCTVSMARKVGMQPPRSLAACCYKYGVDLEHAHSALDDVKATTELLFALRDQGCDPYDVAKYVAGASDVWPALTASGVQYRRATLGAQLF